MSETYTKQAIDHIAMGQKGAVHIASTTRYTGRFIAIDFQTTSKFTTLIPVNSSYIGTSGGNGDAITSSHEFSNAILGAWTEIALAEGTAIAYLG